MGSFGKDFKALVDDVLGPDVGAKPRNPTADAFNAALARGTTPAAVLDAREGMGVPLHGAADLASGSPFTEVNLDLAGGSLPTGKTVNFAGHELYFRREGSSPAARLTVIAGGTISRLYPGMRLRVKFSSLTFILTQGSVPNVGTAFARLVVTTVPGVSYEEPTNGNGNNAFPAIPLITSGYQVSLHAFNFNQIPKSDYPGNAGDFPFVKVTGFSRVIMGLTFTTAADAQILCMPILCMGPQGSLWPDTQPGGSTTPSTIARVAQQAAATVVNYAAAGGTVTRHVVAFDFALPLYNNGIPLTDYNGRLSVGEVFLSLWCRASAGGVAYALETTSNQGSPNYDPIYPLCHAVA